MISMFTAIFGVAVFLGVAGAISLKLGRLWRQHKLPEDIQRHLPKYAPPVHGQPEATCFGIPRVAIDKASDLFGTIVAALSFGDFIMTSLGLQMDLVG